MAQRVNVKLCTAEVYVQVSSTHMRRWAGPQTVRNVLGSQHFHSRFLVMTEESPGSTAPQEPTALPGAAHSDGG